jgi:hypothetical protein
VTQNAYHILNSLNITHNIMMIKLKEHPHKCTTMMWSPYFLILLQLLKLFIPKHFSLNSCKFFVHGFYDL